jgi:large subunit ribosomal protein L4
MSTVEIMTPAGKASGKAELPADIFDVQANVPLIHQVVVAQLAAAREGNAHTKSRGEVSGAGRKPFKQKGTGRARQGSIRAPQMKGGGVVHGPKNERNYDQRTPKKMKAAALRGALSDRARDGRIHVFSALVDGKPSTKNALAALGSVSSSKNVLVVLDRKDENSALSLRNAANVHVLFVDQLNTYDVLISDDVVFTKAALDAFVAGPITGKSVKAVASESEIAE